MTSRFSESQDRFRAFRPSKAALFWSCVAAVIATVVIGFTWGGWVSAGTAQQMARMAAEEARVQLAASFCVERFRARPEAAAELATLRAREFWKRDDFLRERGLLSLAGEKEAVDGAAERCAERLIDKGLPVTKPSARAS